MEMIRVLWNTNWDNDIELNQERLADVFLDSNKGSLYEWHRLLYVMYLVYIRRAERNMPPYTDRGG